MKSDSRLGFEAGESHVVVYEVVHVSATCGSRIQIYYGGFDSLTSTCSKLKQVFQQTIGRCLLTNYTMNNNNMNPVLLTVSDVFNMWDTEYLNWKKMSFCRNMRSYLSDSSLGIVLLF